MKIKRILTNPYAENCYVISEDSGIGVIVDPGCDGENIYLQAIQGGVKPVAILLTHGHFDHVEAVNYLKSRGIDGEVLVADNESADNSRELAALAGARVLTVAEKGYGNALRQGSRRKRV